jgi:hypothetical protein
MEKKGQRQTATEVRAVGPGLDENGRKEHSP